MKHFAFLLVAVLLLTLAGCTENTDNVSTTEPQVTELAKVPTPWKGHMEGTTIHYPDPSMCGTTMMHSEMYMSGNMTLGGNCTVVANHCIGNGVVTNGEVEITTANGDKIFVTYNGTYAVLPTGMMSLSAGMTITGGTGRFEGATGNGTAYGESDPSGNPIPIWIELEGGYILKD